jgi:lipid A 3-O-deacylase
MKVLTFFTPFIFLSLSSSYIYGATPEPEKTIKQSIPSRVLNEPKRNIITVVVENDSIGEGTDKNYTSGVSINYTDVNAKFPRIAHEIDRLIPTFEINQTSSIHYSLGQTLFSPKDTATEINNPNDRPWAAFLYGAMGMISLTDNHTDEVEVTLGVVGPLALGEQSQKFIHKHVTDSPTPKGWANQLKNEPGLMLGWQRAWPMYLQKQTGNYFWSVKPYVGATVGNIRTYANTGFTVRLSPSDSKWQDTPIRIRPAMPGSGIYEIPTNKWSWSLFTGLETRAIARDIFLDGNTFAKSNSIDKKSFVADATAGASLTYNNTRISYTVIYRTKEFKTQDNPEIFGALSVGVRF